MIRLFPARRRAERFDTLVEHGRGDDLDRSSSDLLELVGALRSVPDAEARPEFVADLRDRLMLAAATELTPAPAAAGERDDVARLTIKPSRTRGQRRVRIALGAVAIIGATTSMAVASQSAIPGDALYPLKRAIENTQSGFSFGEDAKGETVLGNASTRLDEVDELTQKSEPDAQLVTQTLNTFADQATEAGDLLMSDYEQHGNEDSIQNLHQFTTDSVDVLSGLEASIPASAHDALVNAAEVLFTIDAAANNVCPDCGAPISELPPQLLAGAAGALSDLTGALAGDQLSGTDPLSGDATGGPQQDGVKGNGSPSGLNPPETPIEIPSPTDGPTSDVTGDGTSGATNGLDNLLPTGGTHTTGGGNGHGGNGGKHHPVDLPSADLTPVTDTVNEVVTGVVDGVTGLLNGLTGN
jgi:hypothetical protein